MRYCRIVTLVLAAAGLFGAVLLAHAASGPTDLSRKPENWQAPDQAEARKRAAQVPQFVSEVKDECKLCRQQRLRDMGLGTKDIPHGYFLLDSPVIKKQNNDYTPVRFMHSKHAASLNDCGLCHHYRPKDPEASETVRCVACHQEPFRPEDPDRLGLKAAYHQNCMGCHEEMDQGPVSCIGCHRENVPDHKELVKLETDPKPWEVTEECLRCHRDAGQEMLSSAHWLWRGPSPYTLERRKEVRNGKGTNVLNNF